MPPAHWPLRVHCPPPENCFLAPLPHASAILPHQNRSVECTSSNNAVSVKNEFPGPLPHVSVPAPPRSSHPWGPRPSRTVPHPWGPRPSRSATPPPPRPPGAPHPMPAASRSIRAKAPHVFFCFFSFLFFCFVLVWFSLVFIYWMVERRNPPNAIHFTMENENAIASKLGGPPTPPASTVKVEAWVGLAAGMGRDGFVLDLPP